MPVRPVWPAKARAPTPMIVPNWRDPVVDLQGRGSFDTRAAGIDTNSPQISAKIHDCDHVFPASIGIPWAP
jgi:hypothetical protein